MKTPRWAHVARHELLTHLRRRSYLITTALVPLLGLGAFLTLSVIGEPRAGVTPLSQLTRLSRLRGELRIGYVDPGGFIRRTPEWMDGVIWRELAGETEAWQALRSNQIDVAFVWNEGYPEDRSVVRLAPGLTPVGDDSRALLALLRANINREADADWLLDLESPLRRVAIYTAQSNAQRGAGSAGPLEAGASLIGAMALPVLVAVLLYSTVFTMSSFLLQSVTTEKENRVIEVLVTSVRPFELLSGKVIGLALLGLGQVLVWTLSGAVLLGGGMYALMGAAAASAGAGAAVLALAYFLLGYLFYASLMACVGAISPTFHDSGPMTVLVLAPGWLPFLFLRTLLDEPSGAIAQFLSILPPTAPLVMLVRVLGSQVPFGQVVLSLALLTGSAVATLWVAARLFRAQLLLAGGVSIRALLSPRGPRRPESL